jgi:predicted nucleic acid-binding protein
MDIGMNHARIMADVFHDVDFTTGGPTASDFDFLIAATAKAHGLILATVNIRHFKSIAGLAVEDWAS